MRQILSLFFLLSVVQVLWAQDSIPLLSLRECLQNGLENNYSLRIIRNEAQIADNNRTLGNAGFLPVLDLESGYNASLQNQKNKMAEGEDVTFDGVYNDGANVGLKLNWTIFEGFKIQTTYAKLKELKQMGEIQIRLSVEELIAKIISEYNNHIYQLLKLKNLKASVDLSKERVRIVEARYQTGSMSHLEVKQAKVDMNTDVYKYISQKETVNQSIINLNKLLSNPDVNSPFLLTDTVIVIDSLIDFGNLRDKTLESNANILLAIKNKKLSQLDIKAIRSRYFPYLKLNAGYGYNYNKYEVSSTRETQIWGLNYGVTLGINLFEGFNTRRDLQNIKIETENKELEIQDLKLNMDATLFSVYSSYRNNLELRSMEQENLVLTKEYYETAVDKYKLGALSGLELREAQQNLLDAEERLLQAEFNIKLCEISLKQLSGDIISYIN